MMFSGNLIEDLIATVERAEHSAQSDEILVVDSVVRDAWFAYVGQATDRDSKIVFWQESGVA
jgi:hypothetical protein